ncbi:MAG: NUDIX domain-containing protein [Flavobacteriaceae bacterium]|nr:NUDIX domain-containing protein [Flavobacteriaceae bacterium]
MYTIFYNEIPILLTDSLNNSSEDSFFYKDDITIESIIEMAKRNRFKDIFLYDSNLKGLWKEFKWFFKIEKAAGGLVKNQLGETLFVYRFDKWDLPKGKIEKGESKTAAAIREVEEECSVNGLRIEKKLQKTYHIFQQNGRETLKITHWYLMHTDYKGKLKPQLEEGITEVVFKNDDDVKSALENTYKNIKLLFHN